MFYQNSNFFKYFLESIDSIRKLFTMFAIDYMLKCNFAVLYLKKLKLLLKVSNRKLPIFEIQRDDK